MKKDLSASTMKALQKLEAAAYHLEQMTKNLNDSKIFSYYLDAFLSSSRSVTFALKKEFSKNAKLMAWYIEKQNEMRKDPLMSFFVQMRNVTVKEGTPDKKTEASINLFSTLTISDSVSIKLTRANGTEEYYESPQNMKTPVVNEKDPVQITKYYFLEYPERDIVSLCSEYGSKLTELVEEAIKVLEE